ncbi:MAG: GGDEF domain-containing response regulator [Bacillota bacterium]
MSILIVDDSSTTRKIVKSYLNKAGYTQLLLAGSAQEAFLILGVNEGNPNTEVELILLDIVLPDMDGRDACKMIKGIDPLQDVPVIIITSLKDFAHLEMAFEYGAVDYITKPVNQIELLARIRSALRLKHEMDRRKAREQNLLEVTKELEEAVNQLNRLSSLDGLTGIANRRRFDEYIVLEWDRGRRNARPLSLVMLDIDFFKAYNDFYGHQAGDGCLKAVATTIDHLLSRPADLVCRYGGEEFAVILPETPRNGALLLANTMRLRVEQMGIPHVSSSINDYITLSLGVATILPTKDLSTADLIAAADKALYQAKQQGKNRVSIAENVFNDTGMGQT